MSNPVINYFDLFALATSFSVNRQALDIAYREAQQKTHPDRFVNHSADIQREAVQKTAQNIAAYQTLKSPVQRACHLLAILGSDFDLSSYTVTDIELLMQQMQYREQLNEIKIQGKHEQLHEFTENLENLTEATVDRISDMFAKGTENDSADLKNHICELQFLNKLAIDLDEVKNSYCLIINCWIIKPCR